MAETAVYIKNENGECIKEEVFIKRSIILRVCCKCCTHIQSIIYDRYIMLMLHAPLLLTTDRLVGKSMLHQLLCYTLPHSKFVL